MKTYRRILVPIDSGSRGEALLKRAAEIAQHPLRHPLVEGERADEGIREGVRDRDAGVLRVRLIDDVQLSDGPAVMIAQERERRAQPGAERTRDLRGIGADHGEVAVVYVELALELGQVP